MEMSDDKLKLDEQNITEPVAAADDTADLDGDIARPNNAPQEDTPSSQEQTQPEQTAETESALDDTEDRTDDSAKKQSRVGVSELIAVSIKTVAVVMSIIIMLTCILAVGLPLQTMRIFNKLGMSERAIDFGERYISRELNNYDADSTDLRGNYVKLSQTSELTNDDFIEALYVTTNLSSKLMEKYYAAGDRRNGEYYAQRTEKYTRMYLSLNDISLVTSEQSKSDVQSVPMLVMRPMVYSYAHSMRELNFRARAYMGETDMILYDSGRMGEVIHEISTSSNSYSKNAEFDKTNPNVVIEHLDRFVDYVGQLGEYLDVEFVRAGVENDLSKRTPSGSSIVSENYVMNNYYKTLSGNEFSLFVTRTGGFSYIYDNLRNFADYAQLAVDFTPSDRFDNKSDERLHQLYWLQELYSVQQRLWYMAMLLHYSSEKFGASATIIRDEYSLGTCRDFMYVTYEGSINTILGVYQTKLAEYVSQYQS